MLNQGVRQNSKTPWLRMDSSKMKCASPPVPNAGLIFHGGCSMTSWESYEIAIFSFSHSLEIVLVITAELKPSQSA